MVIKTEAISNQAGTSCREKEREREREREKWREGDYFSFLFEITGVKKSVSMHMEYKSEYSDSYGWTTLLPANIKRS